MGVYPSSSQDGASKVKIGCAPSRGKEGRGDGMARYTHLLVFAYIVLAIGALLVVVYQYHDEGRRKLALETAETYMTTLATLHRYYAKEIVGRALAGGARFAGNYKDRRPHSLPRDRRDGHGA